MSRLAAAGAIPLDTNPAPAGGGGGGGAPARLGNSNLKADNKTLALAGGVVLVGVILYEKFVGGGSSSTASTDPSTYDTTSADLDQLSADLEAVNAQIAAQLKASGGSGVNMSKTPKPPAKKPPKRAPTHHAPKPKPHKATPRPPHPEAPPAPPKKRPPRIKRKPRNPYEQTTRPIVTGPIYMT